MHLGLHHIPENIPPIVYEHGIKYTNMYNVLIQFENKIWWDVIEC